MSYETVMDADFDEMTEVQRQILEVSDADEQVLTCSIDGNKYCVDIEPVSEVLWNEHDVAEVPNMADQVRGIANLRGRSVAIVDPKQYLGNEASGDEENLILFEPDTAGENQRDFAWLVESVHQVLNVSHDEIDDSVVDEDIRGIIERDEELLIWVSHDCFNGDRSELDPTDSSSFDDLDA